MSRKKRKSNGEVSTEVVDKSTGELVERKRFIGRLDGRLDLEGREVLSNVSRTVTAYLPTMGERIRRYTKMPQMQGDLYHNPDLWDEEEHEAIFNEDGLRVSRHEDRYQDGLKEAKKRKAARDEEDRLAAIAKEQADNAAFSARVKAAISAGTTLPKE